jgi:hypothetical protein
VFRPVLVRWADQFNGSDELRATFLVIDTDLEGVLGRQIGQESPGRLRRGPNGGRNAVPPLLIAGSKALLFKARDVDLDQCPQTGTRLREIAGREAGIQVAEDGTRPITVEPLPVPPVAKGRVKMISEWHRLLPFD